MKNGLNAHPQDFGNVSRDIAMLLRLDPTFVRVSALQFGVISEANATRVKRMVDAGLRVVGLCTSESACGMSESGWVDYCYRYRKYAMWSGVMYDQIGNEWNTKPFWGGSPDARKAFERFRIAQNIIGRPCIAAGVTCENKTKKGEKIKAVEWIKSWLADGADPLAWDLHYYQTDERLKSVFVECVKLLKGKIVTVLETGCSDAKKQEAWYKGIKGGMWGAKAEHVLYYSYNDSSLVGFSLVDKNTNPSPLARKILAGEV